MMVAEAYTVLLAFTSPECVPEWFGNATRAAAQLAALPAEGDYTFWVVGDTQGSGTYEGFMDRVREERPDCVVFLGDVVGNPTEGDHTFFRSELWEMASPCPVLCVPGNHDIDPRTFPLSRFRDLYGPVPAALAVGPDLFLLLPFFADNQEDGGRQAEEAARFLEATLAGRRDSYRHVFLFCHNPGGIFPGCRQSDSPAYVRLAQLMGTYRLTACFAGHLHLYQEAEADGTRYFISGGGGSRLLKGTHDPRGFFHSLVIKVGAGAPEYSVLPLAEREDVGDKTKWWFLARVLPYVRQEPGGLIAGNALVAGMLVLTLCRPRVRPLGSGELQEAGGD